MKAVDPQQTPRAAAFALWMNAPMPMVTLFKTLDVTRLLRTSRRRGYKFNMLMCWCIGKAASQVEEFHLLPVGDKLMRYERLAVNTVATTRDGGINTCDIPFTDDLSRFNEDYLRLTRQVHDTCSAYELGDEYMVLGTSALAQYDIDGVVNIYAGIYNNPFMIWSRYKKRLFRTTLAVSFQFHHTQMDGEHAARFLDLLQHEIRMLPM